MSASALSFVFPLWYMTTKLDLDKNLAHLVCPGVSFLVVMKYSKLL